jgi:hypothetical protein
MELDTMNLFPLYYVPPGVVPPIHVKGYHHTIAKLRPGIAPDGVPEAIATIDDPATGQRLSGAVIGGQIDEQTRSMFKPTQAGWYVAMGNVHPHTLARVRGIGGTTIPGIYPEHEWCVPTLLHLSSDKEGTRRLTSALPAIYKDYQWQTPSEFHDIIDRLGSYLRADETPPIEDALALAADILAINYHLSIHEMTVAGWFNEAFILDVIRAAVDFSE